MKTLGRLATTTVGVTYLHLVFGGIVRISGSGMGCGDHWPRCNGSWIPPFSDFTVMVEYTHRLLALLVIVFVSALTFAAYRRRHEPGVGGRGGVLRAATWALVLVVCVALLGMVTVKLGNRPIATVAHWTLAMTLLAVVVAAAVRADSLGGASTESGSARTVRSLGAGAVFAFLAVVMGGLVAKSPGAGVACPAFPLSGDSPAGTPAGASHIQMTHRVIAYVLFFHILGVTSAITRRPAEAAVVKRAAKVAAALVVLQLGLGAAMVMAMLPPILRSLHQATGIAIWLSMFLATYLARRASTRAAVAA